MTSTTPQCALAAAGLALAVALVPGAAVRAQAKAAYDAHDLSGVWMQKGGGKFGDYPWTAPYKAIADQRRRDLAAGNPYQPSGSSCLPRGLVGMLTTGGYPLEILQRPNEVAILKENGGVLRIHMDRAHLPDDDLTPLFFGDSVGRWEGDVLVVDSISLGATDNIDGQNPHSDAMHVVQRFRRTGADTMEVEVTVEDPKALTRPISTTAHFRQDPGYEMQEYYCVNERNLINGSSQTISGATK
jgi:hypothetical protein